MIYFLNELSNQNKIHIFFEYRTTEDSTNPKMTPAHNRYYVDHDAFVKQLQNNSFTVKYQILGKGLAKYLDDDAMVARIVASKK